jgi:hypothetical protein
MSYGLGKRLSKLPQRAIQIIHRAEEEYAILDAALSQGTMRAGSARLKQRQMSISKALITNFEKVVRDLIHAETMLVGSTSKRITLYNDLIVKIRLTGIVSTTYFNQLPPEYILIKFVDRAPIPVCFQVLLLNNEKPYTGEREVDCKTLGEVISSGKYDRLNDFNPLQIEAKFKEQALRIKTTALEDYARIYSSVTGTQVPLDKLKAGIRNTTYTAALDGIEIKDPNKNKK